jgi:tetratricopeptide (TPR) repeat protein
MQRALRTTAPGKHFLFVCLRCFVTAVFGAETSDPGNGTNDMSTEAQQQALRAYLQLQEQLHAAILIIETNRQEVAASSQRNLELLSTRLKLIEQALSVQMERDSERTQKSSRMMIIMACVFGGFGLLAMVMTAFLLMRTMNRLAEISSAIPKAIGGLGAGQAAAALGTGDPSIVTLPVESTRLLGAIERLEKRITELEAGTNPQLLPMVIEEQQGNGHHQEEVAVSAPTGITEQVDSELQDRLSVILGKGQTLLNLGQSENALVCFDEVLSLNPDHAEALVKKGTALERLRRWEEALQCYDRAISVDSGMTLAYLYKGGVFNQLERFSEALACYEQALRTQQKTAVA